MDTDSIKKWHKRLFKIWAFVIFPVCIVAVALGGVLFILELNLAISVYTVLMQHFLGERQEKD
jgi:fatty acid desaturase